MKSCKGIENPAFVASSPENPRRLCASSPCIEISVVSTPDAGSPPPPAPQEPPERPESPQPSGAPDASRLGSLSEYEEGPYGWGSFQPRALQCCNTPRGFLFHYCLLALTQGIVVNGLVNISISTIEKRYELQSSLTGLISSSYDIAFCLLSLFVSFFGERGHKPRWLAFSSFMIGLGALVFSLPKFFSGKYQFGSLFKGTAKIQEGKISQTHQSASLQHTDSNFGQSFKDFPAALKNLMRNTVFMCLVLSTCSEALITTGFATFLPKFIENQFGLSSSSAATLAGTVLIPGAALGQILGGVLVSKFKMTCKNIMKFALLTSVISLVLTFVFAYANCENEPFAGVSELYNGTGELGNLTAPCNADCNCLRSYYYPVCGGNGVQYFSPCYAGCTQSVSKRHAKVYYNCSCIEGEIDVTPTPSSVGLEAQAGKCSSHCKNLPPFLGIFFAAIVFTFMAGTPITVSILRCVNQRQRSLALGIQCTLLRLLGTIPGPIIFGSIIDSTCILWDINECGNKGACWVYNNVRMAYMLVAISVICKIITVFFNGLAVFLYKPPPSVTDVAFQNQNAAVTTVSLVSDLSKAGNDE
ncbi:hypothetical protein FD754_006583 [Muntiacus muntjak]|uniref:Solute carrier organic anion transporter family member n=1 Tax=Muntiacus muntjak TaxID=9888 RepID=A0A5N3WND9_MUNMU|nr:hypothetical protein FD754_006583 [Muntiacus muntjak]